MSFDNQRPLSQHCYAIAADIERKAMEVNQIVEIVRGTSTYRDDTGAIADMIDAELDIARDPLQDAVAFLLIAGDKLKRQENKNARQA